MSNQFTESIIDIAAPKWVSEPGYCIVHGPKVRRLLRRLIARKVVETVRANVTVSWTVKESGRGLRECGYPPDTQGAASNAVLQQSALLSDYSTPHEGASS